MIRIIAPLLVLMLLAQPVLAADPASPPSKWTRIKTGAKWAFRKARRGCQIANPVLQTCAHIAQIFTPFVVN